MVTAKILGTGSYLPERVVTNDELSQLMDTSDEWIRTRTGIVERHIAADDETTATMAIEAAHQALEIANFRPTDLDLIIVATSTPEYIFPSTACRVAHEIGAAPAGAFDLVKIDVDQNPAIAGQLRVQSIPTVYAFHKGQPVDGFQGALPQSQIDQFVGKLAEMGGGDASGGLDDAVAAVGGSAASWHRRGRRIKGMLRWLRGRRG